jgi:hypothetical protein
MAFEKAFARLARDMAKNQADFLRRNAQIDSDFLARYRGVEPDDEDDDKDDDKSADSAKNKDQGVSDGGTSNKPSDVAAGTGGQAEQK